MVDSVGAGDEVLVEAEVEEVGGSSVGRRLVPEVVSASGSEGDGDGGGGCEVDGGGSGGGRVLTSSAIVGGAGGVEVRDAAGGFSGDRRRNTHRVLSDKR